MGFKTCVLGLPSSDKSCDLLYNLKDDFTPTDPEEGEEDAPEKEDAPDNLTESLPVDTESVIESETSSVPTVTAEHQEVIRFGQSRLVSQSSLG